LFSVCACAILRLMAPLANTASGRWYMIPVIALVVGLICASGCGPRYPVGSIDDLFVTNKRYNIDKDKGIVRVFAQVENTGEGLIRQVKMEAVLLSADGDKRGTNNVVLKDIKPGEKRNFSIAVTSHSRSHKVEIVAKEVEK